MPPRLLFVTSSLRTRWEAYSQALIHASGLADRVLVLDGRSNWHPLNFVQPALAFESDYIVHIDEDCFLLDPAQLVALIARMAADPEVVAAGVPDGGTPYRSHNPFACNLFFTVFKTSALRQAIAHRPDWRSLRFDPAFTRHLKNPPAISGSVAPDDYEPYYPLFWLLLSQDLQILYLSSSLHPEWMASEVFLADPARPMALHAWHLCKWFSREIDPFLGISPAEKYRRINKWLNGLFLRRPVLLWHLCQSILRLFRARVGWGRA